METVTLQAGVRGAVLREGIAVRGRALDLRSGGGRVRIATAAYRRLVRGGRLGGPARMTETQHGHALIVPASPRFNGVLVHVAVQGEATVVNGVAEVRVFGELVQLHPGAIVEYERLTGPPWRLVLNGANLDIQGLIRLADARRNRRGDWHFDDVALWAAQAAEGETLPSLVTSLCWRAELGRPTPIDPRGSPRSGRRGTSGPVGERGSRQRPRSSG
jgi:hypothetical protein